MLFDIGIQHGTIFGTQPYGLPLGVATTPQYLRSLGYRAHGVGKVSVRTLLVSQPEGDLFVRKLSLSEIMAYFICSTIAHVEMPSLFVLVCTSTYHTKKKRTLVTLI